MKAAVFFALICLVGANSLIAQDIKEIEARTFEISFVQFREPVNQNKPLHKDKIKKSVSSWVSLDLPLMPNRLTIDVSRVRDNSLNSGTVHSPWQSKEKFFSIVPEFNFFSKNISFNVYGGPSRSNTKGPLRTTESLGSGIEGSIWLGLIGIKGFGYHENVHDLTDNFGLSGDFSRISFGGKAWTGIKFGSFSSSFVAVRYGRGYARSDGKGDYVISAVNDTEPIPLYSEEFLNDTASVQAKFHRKNFSLQFLAEGNKYVKLVKSADFQKFGFNEFRDLKTEGSFEFTPVPKVNPLRFVIVGTKFFKSRDGLIFQNRQPELQIFVRIKI